jgi:hypothetical protein
MKTPINFVVTDERKWAGLLAGDMPNIAQIAPRIDSNEDVWCVLTYLQLAARGHAVSVSSRALPETINVVDGIRFDFNRASAELFCVGCRGDGPYPGLCQAVIHQNLVDIPGQASIYIPQWPQPGLIPRAQSRDRIERIGFMGHARVNLQTQFRDEDFQRQLRGMGCTLVIRDKCHGDSAWHDCADIDLVLAKRNIPAAHLRLKPANKLINAWMAGTPALLGREPAVEAICSDELDYIRIDQPTDVLNAIAMLRQHPMYYEAMVRHGLKRARSYSDDAISRRWGEVLLELREIYEAWSAETAEQRLLIHAQRVRSHLESAKSHDVEILQPYIAAGFGERWWETDP